MTKIILSDITSGYNLSAINSNFQKLEDELNNKVLYRQIQDGEPNSMASDLDMNGRSVLNANKISSSTLEVGGVPVVPKDLVADPYNGTREALRRSYAEAGYNLVAGSFESGGTLVNSNDALLQELTGKAYSYIGTLPYTVAAGTNPVGDYTWKPVIDELLREDLASKNGIEMIGGDLYSYGADKTGSLPCDASLEAMLSDGRFVVSSGKYLLSSPHTIDVSLMKIISIGPDVEFLIKTNVSGLIFKNVITDVIGNGMRVTVDIPGGGYSGIALSVRGTKYFTPPSNLGRLTNKTNFGPFYVYNKQGASKQEVAASPVMDEGYGFSIDCNSTDEEILIWNSMDVSSTGFTVAHSISVGTNPLNFISSLDLNLVAWFSTYHFRDSSQSPAGGNVSSGIGDVNVRLKSQPHPQMQKIVHMEHAPGYMGGCRFDLSIWDAQVFGYRAGVVDASITNEYSNTLERYSYPLTRALNTVDGSLFPVVNYYSSIQESDVIVSSNSELAKYLYLSTVTPAMSVIDACNAVKTWCNENNVRHALEFRITLVETTPDIKNIFMPWLAQIGDDNGFLTFKTSYYNGVVNYISVVYELDIIATGGREEVHNISWSNESNSVSHKLVKYSYGTTSEIKAKSSIMPKGFSSYDTSFNIPVWFNGSAAFLKADGGVAYTV